jgi:predicted ATPase/DNA-binding SARP family transcriptional activator
MAAPSTPQALPDRYTRRVPTLAESDVRVAVLGPVLVTSPVDGTWAEPPGTRGKTFVVSLALAPGQTLSAAGLVDDLWGDAPPRAAKPALQTLVSRLRQVCHVDLIRSTTAGYSLAGRTDLGLAHDLRDEARGAAGAGEHEVAVSTIGTALDLWRGDPGADLGESEVAEDLRRSAAKVRDELVSLRATSRLALGDAAGSLSDLDSLGHPAFGDEELVALRMRALDASGRRADAIRAFADHRERLADELGTSPSSALIRLNTELLIEEPESEARARTTVGIRTAPNELLGRGADVSALEGLLATARLTTILGPGGLGKTRLAHEIARRAEGFDVVLVVELASVRSGEDVTLALATVLGIRDVAAGRLTLSDPMVRIDVHERILSALGERSTLLVVDNCEHLVDAAAQWVAEILEATTDVRVLATSRAPLMIGAERVYPLDSLSSSTADSEDGPAVALFRARAMAARPGVVLPRDVVRRLCTRLDGLPLAIELAAARVRSMPVEEIERRLENRFVLLTSGDRSAPERHRTLTAVIDWSWNLLGTSEQALLRRLSRFPDGFDAVAAQIVGATSADVANDLDGLVTQSLVSVAEDASLGSLRYRMLETVREFGDLALREAGEEEVVREAMFRWAEHFAEEAVVELDGSDQVRVFASVAREQDNLVAILRAAIDRKRPDTVVRLFSMLGYYWSMRGRNSDVTSFAAPVLAATAHYRPDADHRDAAMVAFALAGSVVMQEDRRTGLVGLGRLRALKRSGPAVSVRINTLSDLLLLVTSDLDAFRAKLDEYVTSSDPTTVEWGYLLAAQLRENDGDVVGARVLGNRAYEVAAAAGHVWVQATAAATLAELAAQHARPRDALVWLDRAIAGLASLQANADVRHLSWIRAAVETAEGRGPEARRLLEELIADGDGTDPLDEREYRLIGLTGLAEVDLLEGKIEPGMARYRQLMSPLTVERGARSPWVDLAGAACLAAHVRVDSADRVFADALANRLRTRTLAVPRAGSTFVDHPILGSTVAAIAAWLMWPGRDTPPSQRGTALELFFVAEGMGARQDLGSLDRARLETQLLADRDSTEVASARASVAGLSPAECRRRALVLLADRSLRSPFIEA